MDQGPYEFAVSGAGKRVWLLLLLLLLWSKRVWLMLLLLWGKRVTMFAFYVSL
jgi:hypothetical protein